MLANSVLLCHFMIAIFIIAGMIAIPIGHYKNWTWIRAPSIRIPHAGLMMFVTIETLMGWACPISILEAALRGQEPIQSFWGYWLNNLLYWNVPSKFFIIAYLLASIWTIVLWIKVPPRIR